MTATEFRVRENITFRIGRQIRGTGRRADLRRIRRAAARWYVVRIITAAA
jgi:hypothetical protein